MPSLLCSSWLPSRTITGRIDSQIGFFLFTSSKIQTGHVQSQGHHGGLAGENDVNAFGAHCICRRA